MTFCSRHISLNYDATQLSSMSEHFITPNERRESRYATIQHLRQTKAAAWIPMRQNATLFSIYNLIYW